MAAYDPVQDVIEEEGLDTAPRAQPVFQPDTPAYDPVEDTIAEEKPVFQPLHPDAQGDGDRPVFQSAHGPAEAIELPAQTTEGQTHIELTRPGKPFARSPLPDDTMPFETDQQALAVPRAYTPQILAARQQAEQFGGDFAQRAPRAGAVGAAAQQALQFDPTSASAAAAAGQQNFVEQHAQAQVNSPASLYNYANDLYGKTIGNFESLINTVRQGSDTDDLQINRAVDLMLPDGSPEDKAAFRQAFIAGTPDQRSQWMGALLPYVSGDTGLPVDTASLSDALDRKNDPAYQAAKAKNLKDAQDEAKTLLEGDPRLKGTTAGNIISQIAALPAYTVASGAVGGPIGLAGGAMVGVPVIFNRIFSDTWQSLKQANPTWTDEQLDNAAAQTALINTVGSEVTGRIVGAGLSPLLKNIRGGYLARAAVQVPATAAAQAGVGAATQAATNIAQGKSVGDAVLEAALGQGIVGGMAGAVHATVHPPLAPEAVPTTGPSGARIRGPTEATLEQGATEAAAAPEAPPVQPQVERPVVPVEPPVAPPVRVPAVPEEQPVQPPEPIAQPAVRPVEPTVPEAEIAPQRQVPAPEERPPTTAEEPWVSQIANRFTEQRVAAGEIGEIAPGQGYSTEDLLNRGLAMKPEEITQHMSDLMNDRGGDPKLQAAAIRAEESRLSQRSVQASKLAESKPFDRQAQVDANNAFADLTDFHNGPMAKLKNNWHAQGMAMQGEVPVDLSTFNGLRQQWLRDIGTPPPASLEPVIRRAAQRVRNSDNAVNGASAKFDQVNNGIKQRIPTADEVRAYIDDFMKQDPCIRP